jgi:hypothetical protein
MTSEFGTFRLTYEPPSGITSPSVEMTQTGDSTISDMLYLFEAFLQASGFVLKGELKVVEDTPDVVDDGFSLTDNPYSYGHGTITFGTGPMTVLGGK